MKSTFYFKSSRSTYKLIIKKFHTLHMFCHDTARRTEVYCHGKLLELVQTAKIFKTSRQFVDMKMKLPPHHLLFNFQKFMYQNDYKPSNAKIKRFVYQHFSIVDSEYEHWIPPDYVEEPQMVKTIKDEDFRNWAYELNQLWPFLGKKMKREVQLAEERFSIIYLENGMIMPANRYRSYYYWDTYWIILGLLHCEMFTTVRGMLDNFIYLIETYGFIPHGGRIYYISRSQPPLFIPMLKLYYDATKDLQYIKYNIETAEKELSYWLSNNTVDVNINGKAFTLAVYMDESKGPRPEHFASDTTTAEAFDDEDMKEEFYSEIKAAAASGWNFSSRWFITERGNIGTLVDTKTTSILPVDLNAILYWNMKILSEFYKVLKNDSKSSTYQDLSEQWKGAVNAVFWNDKVGVWFDYNMDQSTLREYFYPSNLTPLWTGCYSSANKAYIVNKVVNYLKIKNAILEGGVPASFIDTGQKWDYPYAWSPMQYLLVEGLSSTENEEAQWIAFCIAQKWIRNNFLIFDEYGAMFQKYRAAGGLLEEPEVDLQVGYGWTNGVCLHFLRKYGDKLKLEDFKKPMITVSSGALSFGHHDMQINRY